VPRGETGYGNLRAGSARRTAGIVGHVLAAAYPRALHAHGVATVTAAVAASQAFIRSDACGDGAGIPRWRQGPARVPADERAAS
jgi:hypothetical protein